MESKREIVTLQQIKQEIKRQIAGDLVALCILPAVFYILFLYVSILYNTMIVTIFQIVMLSVLLVSLLLTARAVVQLRNGTYFTVRTDVLIRSADCPLETKFRVSPKGHYRLYFNQGHYDIPQGIHYRWTDTCEMNDDTIFHTAFVGDTFALVEAGKKVLMVFNHRFFDVQV